MLNEKEIEVMEYMDYQVMNNGMNGWMSNRGFDRLHEFVAILSKRNAPLDQEVIALFIRATTAKLGCYQLEALRFLPDVQQKIQAYENEIDVCNESYQETANTFMGSYGLKDYGTLFEENFNK